MKIKIIIICCLLLVILTGCLKSKLLFFKLKLYRRDTKVAISLAKQLSQTPQGVELALKDMSVFGGETRGWSIWILEYTNITNVNSRLKKIAYGSKYPIHKQIQALLILWHRTHNTKYLYDCFIKVSDDGSPVVSASRIKLYTYISEYTNIYNSLCLPRQEKVRISTNEFKTIIDNYESFLLTNKIHKLAFTP